jgi:hypothetical protein
VPLLIALSRGSSAETVRSCSVALSNLSTASSAVDEGTVSALIGMSGIDDGDDTFDALPSSSGAIDEAHKPPRVGEPVPASGAPKPGEELAGEVSAVQRIETEKHAAGMAGAGPPSNTPPLMEPKPLPTAETKGGGEGGEGGGVGEGGGEGSSEGSEGGEGGEGGGGMGEEDATKQNEQVIVFPKMEVAPQAQPAAGRGGDE